MKKIVELSPVRLDPDYYRDLEKLISDIFKEEIYLELLKVLEKTDMNLVENDSSPILIKAIKSGRIVFYRGVFRGKFSAAVSRELKRIGAKWSSSRSGFVIQQSKLDKDMVSAILVSEDRYIRTIESLNKKLDEIGSQGIPKKFRSDMTGMFEGIISKFDKKFNKSLTGISVSPKITRAQNRVISLEYTKNMDKYIQEWKEKEIITLRKSIESNVLSGKRYEGIVKTIQKRYGVSKSKAQFLARQETNLMTAKLREARYDAAGVVKYRWSSVKGSPKHPVRPMHKALDGKIFSWKNPPVTSEDGRRNNPGEDFNCRCEAIPIVEF